MHNYITHNKLGSLYICFAMLHTTLHNEAEILHRRYHNSYLKDEIRIRNSNQGNKIHSEEYYDPNEIETNQGGRKIFDMITPSPSDDLTLWPKTGNYVRISYTLDPSLSTSQRQAIPVVLRSIEDHTCIRFTPHLRSCGDSSASSHEETKLCFRTGRERSAHWGRHAGGPQLVTLAPGDGAYWVLHLVGHALGLPHPHTCLHDPPSRQEHRPNRTRTGCTQLHCPWRRFDPHSALQLTPEELGSWPPPINSASALLALWRTRHAAQLSHWDRLALHEMYRCWESRPHCPPRSCRHGGFVDMHCRCVCPPGYSGDDCAVKGVSNRDGRGSEDACVRDLLVSEELELSIGKLVSLGTTMAGNGCIIRVRTTSQSLRILVTVDNRKGEMLKMSREQSVVLYFSVMRCAIKMHVFQKDRPARTFCMLDYIGEVLSLNYASNGFDLLFNSDSFMDTPQMLNRARLGIRSPVDLSKYLPGDFPTAVTTSAATANITAADASPAENGQTRSAAGDVESIDLIVLPSILFVLMGLNILVVYCIKKCWEYRYGTAGIYRGTEGGYWSDEDVEEPEHYRIKVEYSESFDGVSPERRETIGESSLPQAEMTDLELFRVMYGVTGTAPSHVTEEESVTEPAKPEQRFDFLLTVPSEESQKSAESLTSILRTSPSTSKKRVSFSDENGKPLLVHADAPLDGEKSPAQMSSEQAPELATPEEVYIIVPFSGNSQPHPAAGNGDTDSEESSEESSCCDSSSSSSYHEDEDDAKNTETGLLHSLTRWFRKKRDKGSDEI